MAQLFLGLLAALLVVGAILAVYAVFGAVVLFALSVLGLAPFSWIGAVAAGVLLLCLRASLVIR